MSALVPSSHQPAKLGEPEPHRCRRLVLQGRKVQTLSVRSLFLEHDSTPPIDEIRPDVGKHVGGGRTEEAVEHALRAHVAERRDDRDDAQTLDADATSGTAHGGLVSTVGVVLIAALPLLVLLIAVCVLAPRRNR